jgi:hypothetical protein
MSSTGFRRTALLATAATFLLLGLASVATAAKATTRENPFKRRTTPPPIVGRWDVTLADEVKGAAPSWFEVRQSGYRTLVGSYVGVSGSARPIARVDYDDDAKTFRFAVPPQWERRTDDVVFEGKLVADDVLRGETTDVKGKTVSWEARRAPTLDREQTPQWGEPIELFNGRDLSGWQPRWPEKKNGWTVTDGILTNAKSGQDLLTERKFDDFKLTAEFRYPPKSNSGIYLRGRYEVQIEDTHGRETDSHHLGGIYGHLTPSFDAAKPAGEWQTMEITLVGRAVTVVLNGERIIDRQPIPGITGGALDSKEGEAGPILLQGDHGPVEFRELTLTPAK